MLAILFAGLGGGNEARNFNTGTYGESYGPQTLIPALEHDPDLAPAPYAFPATEMVAQIEATPTPTAAIAPTVTAAAAETRGFGFAEGCPAIIVETFGAHADAACAVAWCESRWNPGAVGDGGASLGAFQIQPRWHQWRVPGEDLMDLAVNVRAAWLISSGGTDWSAWTCKPW